MTFRQFPYMRPFWYPDRDGAFGNLSPQHREWVEHWQDHTAELAKVCRNVDVYAALQSLGVYEIYVESPGDEATPPSDSRAAAYRYFNENEERICRNVTDALLRYYRVARRELPDWFDDDDPDDSGVEQLGKMVGFDGFSIAPSSSGGLSPLRLVWDPDWDPEHGLLMAVFQDQVLAIGNDDVDEFLLSPEDSDVYGVWGRQHMTEQERTLLEQFIANFEPCEDDDW